MVNRVLVSSRIAGPVTEAKIKVWDDPALVVSLLCAVSTYREPLARRLYGEFARCAGGTYNWSDLNDEFRQRISEVVEAPRLSAAEKRQVKDHYTNLIPAYIHAIAEPPWPLNLCFRAKRGVNETLGRFLGFNA